MARYLYKSKKGFTIVEVLISITILSVIAAIMLSFLVQGSSLYHLLTNQSELRSVSRNAMNYMTRELRMATRTSNETPSPNLSIPSKPNNKMVHFYLPVVNENTGYIIDEIGATEWDKSNKIQYQYIPGLNQLRRLEKGTHYIIANNVTNVEFEDHSVNNSLYNDELKIILTLERDTPHNRRVSVTLTSIVKLRNQ